MKSKLINYTDKGFKKLLIEEILRMNPLLTMGEDITAPQARIQAGRLAREEEPKVKTIQLDRTPDHILEIKKPPPITTVMVGKPIKITMKAIEECAFEALNFQLDRPTFFHFYRLDIPHRGWLEEYDVGDDAFMTTIDEATFQPVYTKINLTQEIMDEHSYVTLRYALST